LIDPIYADDFDILPDGIEYDVVDASYADEY
jgi:hypothetical protein